MKARILVIEDEMSINDLLCMNLEIAGYETVGYLDGNEAYEAIIQDHAFQCALVDIMLPGRDGYSLLPKLKQYEIPVIFLTAKGDIASKIKGLKDGAEDYIVKPFEIGKFSYYLCEQTIRECTDYIKSREEKKKSPDKISVA